MKKRIDRLLVERGLVDSREKAQALIMAGNVLVDEEPATKAGMSVPENANIRLKEALHPYVSRGGVKLEGASVLTAKFVSMSGRQPEGLPIFFF